LASISNFDTENRRMFEFW